MSANAVNVNAMKASRALPASAKSQRNAASKSTTSSAMAEGSASVIVASVWRVTRDQTARTAWAAPTSASQSCQWWKITIMIVDFAFVVVVVVIFASCFLQKNNLITSLLSSNKFIIAFINIIVVIIVVFQGLHRMPWFQFRTIHEKLQCSLQQQPESGNGGSAHK